MRKTVCKECGKAVQMIKVRRNVYTACEYDPVYYIDNPKAGNKFLITAQGERIRCDIAEDPKKASGTAYLPHAQRCKAQGGSK